MLRCSTARGRKYLPPFRICGIVSGMRSKQFIAMSCFLAATIALMPPISRAREEKLKPEELVTKHLDSIAPAEKRKALKSRSTMGSVQVSFRVGGSGTLNGQGNIISQGNSVRAGFS